MKTIWFGWLIIGKLLMPPKHGTSNHIFVSFVSKEVQFLSWHWARAVLLAIFGTQHCIAAVSCPTLTPHLVPPHSCQAVTTWDMSIQLQLSTLQWLSSSLRQFSQLLLLTPNDTLHNLQEVFAALEKSGRFAAPEDLRPTSRRMEKLEFPPSWQRNYAILNWAVTFIS